MKPTENRRMANLLGSLLKQPRETEWLEFKRNQAGKLEQIGEYISALANSAVLKNKNCAYLVWGVADQSHEVVGTSFSHHTKIGNEDLSNHLLRLLEPKVMFRFHEWAQDGKKMVILQIPRARDYPVKFKGEAYVRVQSYKKRLAKFPAMEKELWRVLGQTPFEKTVAVENANDERVLDLLNCRSYFELMGRPPPEQKDEIFHNWEEEEIIRRGEAGGWDITGLGAIALANNLDDFDTLRGKKLRVIVHHGKVRAANAKRDWEENAGYASRFAGRVMIT